jgi:hypothetical protein
LTWVYAHLLSEVNRIARPGMGTWPDTWQIVEYSTKRFEEACKAYRAGVKRNEAVKSAARALVAAWERAASAWDDAHRPQTTPRQGGPNA